MSTKLPKKPNDTVIKKLILKQDYKSFGDFYNVNKELIYRTLANLFKSLKRKDKNNVTLVLGAKINGLQWETELKFKRQESIVLVRDILPFFETNEDYETCGEITDTYNIIIKIQSDEEDKLASPFTIYLMLKVTDVFVKFIEKLFDGVIVLKFDIVNELKSFAVYQ